MTFQAAAEEYIESKRNVLSPSTIRGYMGIIRQIPETFLLTNVHDITALDVQDEDIRRILEYAKGTEYEIPLILACYGLRRSEICALTPEDINGDILSITKAKVQGKNNEWIIKTTKTTASKREIIIPTDIANKIYEKGYIYKGYPNSITIYLTKTEEKLGIPHFPLHKLRHYFASKMSFMNIPEEDIMRMGGWETDYVMKGVYRHAMEDKNQEAQRKASEKLKNILFSTDKS